MRAALLVFLVACVVSVQGCRLLDSTIPCEYANIASPEVLMEGGVWLIRDRAEDLKYVFSNIREMVGAFSSTQSLKDATVKVTLPIPQASLNQLRSLATMAGLPKLVVGINQAS